MPGNLRGMLVTALLLIVAGVLLGLFFPAMFVAAAAGLVLLVVSLIAGARRTAGTRRGSDPAPDRPE